MERLLAKIIAGIAMFFAILICFLLPIKLTGFFLRKGNKGQYYLDLLACFAGGVFLAAYLMFMAPSVRELLVESLMRPNGIEYPLPDMLIGIGFFLLMLINRIVITMSKLSKHEGKHSPRASDYVASTSLNSHEQDGAKRLKDDELNDNGSVNGIVLQISHSDTTATMITVEPDLDIDHHHTNSPYPLPRRSSITDVAHQDTTIRSVMMMLALSLDSILEGITTGLKTTTIEVWAIFIGNLVHETVIAFCLGLQLIRVQQDIKSVVIAALAYSLMNPIGLLLATAVFESIDSDPRIDLANGVFQALTSGVFIYVTFCEILDGQITHKTSFAKIAAMFAGYAILGAFAAVPGSSSYNFSSPHINCSSTS